MDSEQQPVVAATLFRAGKTNPYELALIALDRLGRIRWQAAYQSSNRDFLISDIKCGSDGSLYVAGLWGLQISSNPGPFLAAFDAQGRLKWSRTIPLGVVDGRVKIALRANEIGLGFTSVQNLYDFMLYRFDYNGNQRGALVISGNNSEDILADLQVLPNGNFVALLETNALNPALRSAGVILFNAMSGVSGAFLLQNNGGVNPQQLSIDENGLLNLGLRTANAFHWVQTNSSGQNIAVLHAIDSLADYQQYRVTQLGQNFIAQGPIGNSQGNLELIARSQNAASWSITNSNKLYSSLSAPISDPNGNIYVLATASDAGPDFNQQLIYIKTNTQLELCYEQKSGISKLGQSTVFSRTNMPLQVANLILPAINMTWTPQTIQFSPNQPVCNTIKNTPILPTAFSPNDDGLNDSFGPLFSEFPNYILSIFDRWGGLVYAGENQHWDGTKQSEKVSSGVYPYVLDYTDTRGRISRISGQVTLIR